MPDEIRIGQLRFVKETADVGGINIFSDGDEGFLWVDEGSVRDLIDFLSEHYPKE